MVPCGREVWVYDTQSIKGWKQSSLGTNANADDVERKSYHSMAVLGDRVYGEFRFRFLSLSPTDCRATGLIHSIYEIIV
jgi:hypothetical protein